MYPRGWLEDGIKEDITYKMLKGSKQWINISCCQDDSDNALNCSDVPLPYDQFLTQAPCLLFGLSQGERSTKGMKAGPVFLMGLTWILWILEIIYMILYVYAFGVVYSTHHIIYLFIHLFICLEREREHAHMWARGMDRGKGRDTIPSRLHAEHGAWLGAWSHDPEIMIGAKIKGRFTDWATQATLSVILNQVLAAFLFLFCNLNSQK